MNNNTSPKQGENEEPLLENPHKRKHGAQIFGIIFTLIMTAAVLLFIFNFNDFNDTMRTLAGINGTDAILSIACLLLFIIICPLSVCVLGKAKKIKSGFMQNYLVGASEHFFNGITPYQTGAQPFQVYSLSRRGVPASDGTGVVVVNYLAHIVALNIILTFSLIYSGEFFGSFIESGSLWIPIIGIAMSYINLAVFLCIVFCKWVRNFFKNILRLLCKIRFIGKHLSKSIPTFDNYCDTAQNGAREVISHPKSFAVAVIIRLTSLVFYYAVPFFILRGLGVGAGWGSFVYTVLAACFATNAVAWIPTPGTSGGIEYSFSILFTVFAGFGGTIAAAAAIIWRALTYYLLLIISFIQYLLLEICFRKKKN